MKNVTGQNMEYDEFKSYYDSDEQFKELVDKFDNQTIVLKTKNKIDPATAAPGANTVDKMAKRAAAKMIAK